MIYNCECLDCGYQMETEEHCYDLRCPLCGGPMRRLERPGPGRISQGESGAAVGFAFFAGLMTALLANIITVAVQKKEEAR
jgi:hypothetical protein